MSNSVRRIVPYDAVRTRTCYLWFDRFLFGRFLPQAAVTLEDARVNIEVCQQLTSGRAVPALIDMRDLRSQTTEARDHLAGPSSALVASAVALLAESDRSVVYGGRFLALEEVLKPTRMFLNEEEAEAWLATFLPPTP